MANIDWISIKNEYINTNISQRDLAKKFDVSVSTLTKKANKEKWQQQKETQSKKIATKVQQKIANRIISNEVNRLERITTLAYKLIEKLEQGIEQLDKHLIVNVSKKKETSFEDAVKVETYSEEKTITSKSGLLKVNDIKNLASALKDIRDIQSSTSVNDTALEKLDNVLEKIEGEI